MGRRSPRSTAPETAKQQGQVTQLISISKLCSQIHSTWNSKATRPSYTADQHIQTVQPNPQHLKQQSNTAKLHSWSAYPNCAAKSTAPETAKQHSQVTQLISISKLCSQIHSTWNSKATQPSYTADQHIQTVQPNPQHLKQQSNTAKLHSWSAYPNCAAKSTAPETAKQHGQVTQLISISKLCSQIHSTWNSKATRPSYTADQHIQTVQPNPQHLKQQSNTAKLHSWSAYPNYAAKQQPNYSPIYILLLLCVGVKQKIITFIIYLLRVGWDDRNRTKVKSATIEQVISESLSFCVWSVAKVRNFCLFACLCIWYPLPDLFMISFIQTEKMDHSAGCMLHKQKDISFRQPHPRPTLSLCQLHTWI